MKENWPGIWTIIVVICVIIMTLALVKLAWNWSI